MTKLKSTLKRAWNWLLGKTTIDEKLIEVAQEVKGRAKAVNEQLGELQDELADVKAEIKDVVTAAKGGITIEGKVTEGKIRAFKKDELIKYAKATFNVSLDNSLTKTNIVNKVYELHNGKKSSGSAAAGTIKKGTSSGNGSSSSGKKSAGRVKK